MKKITYFIGYIAALATVTATVFKINHLMYTGVIISIGILILSVYIPLMIIDKARDSAEGKTQAAHIAGALCAFVITLSLFLKLNHQPFSGTLIIAGLAGFSLIFIPMLFIQKSKLAGTNNLMNAAGAFGLAFFSLGLMTKIEHWPGQVPLFIAGAVLLVVFYFPMYMMDKTIPEEKKINHLRDTFFVIIIGCFLVLFVWGMLGGKLLPPGPMPDTTEQNEQR